MFINSNSPNFFKEVCNELDKRNDVVFLDFQKTDTSSGVLIAKVEESRWSAVDLNRFNKSVEELQQAAENKLAQSHDNTHQLRDLEDVMRTFQKVDKASDILHDRSLQLFRGQNISLIDVTQSKATLKKLVYDLTQRISIRTSTILQQSQTEVDWSKLLETEHSLLNSAVQSNNQALALRLIEIGTDLESYNREGLTSLSLACKKGNVTLVKALLAKKVSVNKTSERGHSALYYASSRGCVNIINELLAHNASHAYEDYEGKTPLMQAVLSGNLEAVQALLDNGANINKINKNGESALHLACRRGDLNQVNLFLSRAASTAGANNKGITPLMEAAIGGHMAIVQALLDKGVDLNKKNMN